MLPGSTNRNDFGGDFERIVNLRNRTGEERRRQNLTSVTIILFEITFCQTSLPFKQIFL